MDATSTIKLAQVNKAIRRFMLGPTAESIWSRLGRADYLEVMDGLDDLSLVLLFNGTNCTVSSFCRIHVSGD